MINKSLFVSLVDPYSPSADIPNQDLKTWDSILRVLRSSQLLSSYAFNVKQNIADIPTPLRPHLMSAMTFADAQERQVRHAANLIQMQLSKINAPLIFLKGTAYTLANTTNAKGRLFSDIDILVHKQDMPTIEGYLLNNGWGIKTLDDYDEKYYRDWSHELPPFTHFETGTNLDIHHTLLPPISGYQIDLKDLWSHKVITEQAYAVPSLGYMILHSSIHLLLNEDVDKGLRDLIDINHLIYAYFENNDMQSLKAIFARSGCENEFDLLSAILKSLLNPDYLNDGAAVNPTPTFASRMYCQALFPDCAALGGSSASFSRAWVYTRGHLKKMPKGIFFKHIAHKGYRTVAKKLFGDFIFR